MITRLLFGSIFVVSLHSAVSAVEKESISVVVLCLRENGIALQLKAELKTLGYRPVMRIHSPTSLTPVETDKIMAKYGAVALINATLQNGGVEVWVSNPTLGAGKLVEVIAEDDTSTISAETILKSVESLRASLMAHDTSNRVPGEEHPEMDATLSKTSNSAVSPPGRKAEKRSRSWVTGGGLSITHGLGATPPSFRIPLFLAWRFAEHVSVYLTPVFPISPVKIDKKQGRAAVWEGLLLIGARGYLLDEAHRARPWAGLGIGPALIRILGDAASEPDWKSRNDTKITGVLFGQVGVLVGLSDRIAVDLQVITSLSMKRPVVVVGESKIRLENPVAIGGQIGLTYLLF